MEEPEPLFRDGCRLCSNLLGMDDEEPIFGMELASEERAPARSFPNRNGSVLRPGMAKAYLFKVSLHGDIASV
jgi:hypothetical protein